MTLAPMVPYLCLKRADALVTEDESDAALAAAQEGIAASIECEDLPSQVCHRSTKDAPHGVVRYCMKCPNTVGGSVPRWVGRWAPECLEFVKYGLVAYVDTLPCRAALFEVFCQNFTRTAH